MSMTKNLPLEFAPEDVAAEPWLAAVSVPVFAPEDVVVPIPKSAFDLEALAVPSPDGAELEWPEGIAGCFYCLGSGILASYDEGEVPCYCDR